MVKTAICSTSKHNSNFYRRSSLLFCILWLCNPSMASI